MSFLNKDQVDALYAHLENQNVPNLKILLENISLDEDLPGNEILLQKMKEQAMPLLSVAVQTGNLEIVALFLKHGANTIPEYDGLTKDDYPLNIAVDNGNADIVKCLLEHGAYADEVDESGETVLYRALESQHEEIAILLLDYGANPNQHCIGEASVHDDPPIFEALRSSTRVFEKMLEKGAHVNQLSPHNQTTLICDLIDYYGGDECLEKLKLLVQYGADCNIQKPYLNITALFSAVYFGMLKVVEFLLECGANCNMYSDNKTPLDEAIYCEYYDPGRDRFQIIRLLLQAGAEYTPAIPKKAKVIIEPIPRSIQAKAILDEHHSICSRKQCLYFLFSL